jgi:hypothetical protein
MRIFAAGSTAALLLMVAAGAAQADVFLLTNGGRIEGELLNPQESPRQTYVIRTAAGAQLTLERSQVKQVLQPRAEELEYDKIQPRYSDTVEGQWALAQWCLQNNLRRQREKHLRRVIELDPNHVQARHALGYSQFDGKWKTQDEVMTERGYVLHKGHWRLPQEIQVLQEKAKIDVAEKGWMQKLERLLSNVNQDKNARDAIAAINDPFAVKALAKALREDPRDEMRVLLAETLAKIGTTAAVQALALSAVEDNIREVRLTCLDQLRQHENVAAVDHFVGRLADKNSNEIVNRAAVALKQMGNPSAIGPLIDALITTHKRVVGQGNPGQISSSFSSQGGTGMAMGGGPREERFQVQNRDVLDALITLSGGANFGFDERAWKGWYAAQKRQPAVKIRRD